MVNLSEHDKQTLRRIFPQYDTLTEFEKGVAVGKVEMLAALYPAEEPSKAKQ